MLLNITTAEGVTLPTQPADASFLTGARFALSSAGFFESEGVQSLSGFSFSYSNGSKIIRFDVTE